MAKEISFATKKKKKITREINGVTYYLCKVCKKYKILSEFVRDKNMSDGYANCCKMCNRKRAKKSREKNTKPKKWWVVDDYIRQRSYCEQDYI